MDATWESLTLTIGQRPARVRVQGAGPPLLLIHGGWAGAEAHWGLVFDRFALRHRVIAPELPGIMDGEALPSYADYARWVRALLEALDVRDRVACVGNSLGAAITMSLAAVAPEQLSAIVLVNGGVRADRSPAVRLLRRVPGGVRAMRRMVRYSTYSPRTIARAFADPSRAPREVVETVSRTDPPQLDVMLRLFLAGVPDGTRTTPTLVVWGRRDRLIGMSVAVGRRVARDLRARQFVLIHEAGHLPQVEQPETFVHVVSTFVDEVTAARTDESHAGPVE